MFNIVKLSVTLDDPIPGQRLDPLPLPVIIDGEKKWKVEEILNNHWHWRRFQFLVKQKGYSREYNSWEAVSNISVLDLIVEYYCKYPIASRYIYQTDFNVIFKPGVIASRYSNLKEGVSIRGLYQCHLQNFRLISQNDPISN